MSTSVSLFFGKNRNARNALFAAIAVAGIAFLNLSNAVTLALTPAGPLWKHIVEIIIYILLLASSFSGLPLILRGDIERAVWRLIVVFLFVTTLQISLRASIGLAYAVMTAMLLSAIGYLTLSPRAAAQVTALVFGVNAALIIFDLYADSFFSRLPTPAHLITSITNLAAFVFTFQIIILITQARTLSLNTKLANLLSLFTVVVVFLIGLMSIRILSNALTQQQNRALLGGAQQVTNRLDEFITTNLDILRGESIQPDLSLYLLARKSGFFDPTTRNRPLQVLKLYQSREPQTITSYGLLDENGLNVLDTNGNLMGHSEANQEYFWAAFKSGLPHVSPIVFDQNGRGFLYFSTPIRDTQGRILGVLRAQYDAVALQNIVQEFNNISGRHAFAAIVDENGLFIAHGLQPELRFKFIQPLSDRQMEMLQKAGRLPTDLSNAFIELPGLSAGLLNADRQTNFDAQSHLPTAGEEGKSNSMAVEKSANAVVSMKTRPWKVIYSQSYGDFLEPVYALRRGVITAGTILATLGAALGVLTVRALITPLQRLTETTNRIAQGDLTARANIQQEDEIGNLAATFNNMAEQLAAIIGQLEERVAERTQALERRALQIQTAAEIGNAAASLHDLNTLLTRTTYLISSRFGFYHTGIFLLDEQGEYAVLRAANSAGGQRMLARGHRLKVGETGIVGFVTHTGKPRIALDVGQDAVYFDNPDLPETRSEMAVPLIAGGKILGALDVQSTEEAAFHPEDVETLQVLADQLAIAIENARLFEQNQQALEAIRRAYGEVSRVAWRRMQREGDILGFVSHETGKITPVSHHGGTAEMSSDQPQVSQDGKTLFVPIKIHGLHIGTIRLKKPDSSSPWSNDEIQAVRALSDQLSGALESARLYREAQYRAEAERVIAEISQKIGATIQFESILQTTAEELSQALDNSEVFIQIYPGTSTSSSAPSSDGTKNA